MKDNRGESGDDFARHFDSIRPEVIPATKLCHASAEQYESHESIEEKREGLIRSLFWTDPDGERLYTDELAEEVWKDKIKWSRSCDVVECIWRPNLDTQVSGVRTTSMFYGDKPTAVTVAQITEIDLDQSSFILFVNGKPRMNGRIEDVVAYAEDELGMLYRED